MLDAAEGKKECTVVLVENERFLVANVIRFYLERSANPLAAEILGSALRKLDEAAEERKRA